MEKETTYVETVMVLCSERVSVMQTILQISSNGIYWNGKETVFSTYLYCVLYVMHYIIV